MTQRDMFATVEQQRAAEFEHQDTAATMEWLEFRRAHYLKVVRRYLVRLYHERWNEVGDVAYVTADDAREYIESIPGILPASELSRNFLGATFRLACWQKTGRRINSRTEGSHANELNCWRYRAATGKGENDA